MSFHCFKKALAPEKRSNVGVRLVHETIRLMWRGWGALCGLHHGDLYGLNSSLFPTRELFSLFPAAMLRPDDPQKNQRGDTVVLDSDGEGACPRVRSRAWDMIT